MPIFFSGKVLASHELGEPGAGAFIDCRKSLADQDTVLVLEGHEVCKGSERNELQFLFFTVAEQLVSALNEGNKNVEKSVQLTDRFVPVSSDT